MSRDPGMDEGQYREMLDRVGELGYDVDQVKRVPQRWPQD
jgi:hypothetical protein